MWFTRLAMSSVLAVSVTCTSATSPSCSSNCVTIQDFSFSRRVLDSVKPLADADLTSPAFMSVSDAKVEVRRIGRIDTIRDRLCLAPDHRQRRAQLVRHVRHE